MNICCDGEGEKTFPPPQSCLFFLGEDLNVLKWLKTFRRLLKRSAGSRETRTYLHVSFTLLPSGTITSDDVSSGMKSGGITTSRYPICKISVDVTLNNLANRRKVLSPTKRRRQRRWRRSPRQKVSAVGVEGNKQVGGDPSIINFRSGFRGSTKKFNFRHVSQFVIYNSTFGTTSPPSAPTEQQQAEEKFAESLIVASAKTSPRRRQPHSPDSSLDQCWFDTCNRLCPPRWQTWCEDSTCWRRDGRR